VPGMGGAMELAQNAKRVVVLMSHTDKYGNPKIVNRCSLPLTSSACVDLIITDMAVFNITAKGLVLIEQFSPYSVKEIQLKTGCEFSVSPFLKTIIK
jgi:acetate CoA/acetoacetate CoA-transferase beta subunit